MSDDTNNPADDAAATVGDSALTTTPAATVDPVLDTPAGLPPAAGPAFVGADPPPATPAPPAARGKRAVRRQITTQVVDAVTTSTVPQTTVVDTEEAELPSRVTLAAPYAFYDEENVLHSWLAGSVVEDPAEIAVLVDRGAVFAAE